MIRRLRARKGRSRPSELTPYRVRLGFATYRVSAPSRKDARRQAREMYANDYGIQHPLPAALVLPEGETPDVPES
jgi:hypothetical protein